MSFSRRFTPSTPRASQKPNRAAPTIIIRKLEARSHRPSNNDPHATHSSIVASAGADRVIQKQSHSIEQLTRPLAVEARIVEPVIGEFVMNRNASEDTHRNEPPSMEAAWQAYWPTDYDSTPRRHTWKRVLDITIVLLLAPLWLPVMAAITLYIKIVSPGPIVFRQPRIGFQGQEFNCFKFRSMHHGAKTERHEDYFKNLMKSNRPMEKLDREDSRLIPWGVAFRAAGLDELPQLFNVLRGDMSLVGPRPCTPSEYENYMPWNKRRCDALPGITGLWQVSGKNSLTFNQMIALDIEYAHNQSLVQDLRIMVRTCPVLVNEIGKSVKRKYKLYSLIEQKKRTGSCIK
jgi:lipopolysaccharide/colanic/teichoic acid biosynthesis glycosyltransferase